MKLDPKEFHRMRFEAALQYLNNTAEEAWELADAFLAAGGYECSPSAQSPSRHRRGHDYEVNDPAHDARVKREALEDPKLIAHLVDRFLGWKLPEDFCPDCGIEFKRMANELTVYARKNEPIGTNLFTAAQARQMFLYCLGPAPEGEDTNG